MASSRGTAPPVPKSRGVPRPLPASARAREPGPSGFGQLLAKTEKRKEQKDTLEAVEFEQIDLSAVDADAVVETQMCPRCELQIRVDIFDGHWHSHSSEILPWLFLGGRRNADNEKELVERTKVTHILNVAKECDLDRRLEGMFVYKKIEMHDSKDFDLLGSITDAVQFIQDAHDASPQNRVLVHCVQGISRSASVVVAYLVHSGMCVFLVLESSALNLF